MNIENWVMTVDRRVQTADATQIDFLVGKFVQTRGDSRQLLSTQRDHLIAL